MDAAARGLTRVSRAFKRKATRFYERGCDRSGTDLAGRRPVVYCYNKQGGINALSVCDCDPRVVIRGMRPM